MGGWTAQPEHTMGLAPRRDEWQCNQNGSKSLMSYFPGGRRAKITETVSGPKNRLQRDRKKKKKPMPFNARKQRFAPNYGIRGGDTRW